MNTITYCDITLTADVAGVRVGHLREHLRHPLSVPPTATAFLDGHPAHDDVAVPRGAELEFLQVSGRKAVGRVWSTAAFCEQFDCSDKDLERWVREGLRVLELANGDIRITETAVDDFLRAGGSISSPTRNKPEDDPPRRADTRTEPPSDLTPFLAAAEIGCSRSQVYKLIRTGELTSRRVGRAHRITRQSVDDYRTRNTSPARPPAPPAIGGYKFKHL